jgi:hypothetical protein
MAVCEYCGSRFLIPESVRTAVPRTQLAADTALPRVDVGRWIRLLVIFIIVTTVVPTVCGIVAAVCGVLVPIAAGLLGQ